MSIFNMYPPAPGLELSILWTRKYLFTNYHVYQHILPATSATSHMLRWRELFFLPSCPLYIHSRIICFTPHRNNTSNGFTGITLCSTFSWLYLFFVLWHICTCNKSIRHLAQPFCQPYSIERLQRWSVPQLHCPVW